MSVFVETYGTGKYDGDTLSKAVREVWGLKPAQIIENFDLRKPKFRKTAAYGHFGREEEGFTWEAKDKVEAIKDVAKTLAQ